MMVATLLLKTPKLIVYFVSFTVVIFTILGIESFSLKFLPVSILSFLLLTIYLMLNLM